MPKTLSAGFILEKNRKDPQSPWIELYELWLSETGGLWLTNHPRPVVYGTREYTPYPIRHEEIQDEVGKGVAKLSISVSNILREPQWYLENHDGLRGKKLVVRVINVKRPELGDIAMTFYVESAQATAQAVTVIVGKPIDALGLRVPARLISRDLFPGVKIA